MSIGNRIGYDPNARTAARQEWRRAVTTRGGWPEIPRERLRFERFGRVVDERDGSQYKVHRGEVDVGTKAVVAFFVTSWGDPCFLERMPGCGR